MKPEYYSTAQFEEQYTYHGSDLGAVWSKDKTTFRLWAPTAIGVKLNLYKGGTAGVQDLICQIEMTPDVRGTWVTKCGGDLHGVYYTYLVTVDGKPREVCDPYARTTGVNGDRAMVIDLKSTDPEGWESDRDPHEGNAITDAVIYELHVRDLSIHPSSGIQHKGKFLGVIEEGTKTPDGVPTGLDHIRALGVTHVQILPMYDYGTVDESRLDIPQYNWGYDPVNYNVPEGSYATDPTDGSCRVRELKQMIKGLHDRGLSVVMDVVYNHVYEAETFCFNQIVPNYFSRTDKWGRLSNGSGCGNDTASERSMVKKYIVDSVKYWADEYHIDGFRFDLVGLIDTETVNAIVEEVRRDHPSVLLYGEGWSMATRLTKPGYALATQLNSTMTPDFGFFNDTLRDLIRGSVFDDNLPGFVSGEQGLEDLLAVCFMGQPDWCKIPTQAINYASCHDNMALYDRITQSTPKASREQRIRMNKLAAAIYLTAQGVPFIHAGEEMLRSKPLPDGTFDENSYKSPDSVNSIKWDLLSKPSCRDTVAYYQGLIAFRQAHPALRLTTVRQIDRNLVPISGLEPNTAAFHINGGVNGEEAQGLYIIFNANQSAKKIPLPQGKWNVYVDDTRAGTCVLATAQNRVTVPPVSAMMLVKEEGKAPSLIRVEELETFKT